MANEVLVQLITFKLINEKSDPIKEAVIYATATDANIADNILATQISGFDKKARKYLRYGENHYSKGLPNIELGSLDEYDSYFSEYYPINYDFSVDGFYPIVPLRLDGVFLNEDTESETYLESRKIMKKIGIKFDDLIEGLKGTEEEPNTDIDKLDDSHFMFAVDVYSNIEETAEYLYNFFAYIEPMSIIDQATFETSRDSNVAGDIVLKKNYILFQEGQFDMRLTWNYMKTDTESGTLPEEVIYYKEIQIYEEELWDSDNGETITIQTSGLVCKKQVAPGVIETVSMWGAYLKIKITALGDTKYVYKALDIEFMNLDPQSEDPLEAEKAGTGGFFIPMAERIVNLSSPKHSQIMLYDGTLLTLYAADSIHLKWYQTFLFRVIMTFVTIVFSVIIPYIGGVAVATIVKNLIIQFALGLILAVVLELILSNVDGALAVFIATVVAFYAYSKFGGGIKGMPFATELLHATKAITKVATIDQGLEAQELSAEMRDFDKSAKEKQAEIDKANDLMDNDGNINPLYLLTAYTTLDPSDSPSDFYERCIHTGNPGVLSLDAVNDYIFRMLELPDPENIREPVLV